MTDSTSHPHFGEVRLGRSAVSEDDRTLKLGEYLTDTLPTPPATVQNGVKVAQFPMYANDSLGDCTCAAVGHMAEVWTSWNTFWMPTVKEVTDFYWATGDGSGKDDTGRNEVDVLNYWRQNGFGTKKDKIAAYASVNVKNRTEVKQATYLFGGVYIGISLPISAQGQTEWSVVPDDGSGNTEPGSWGGHAVNVTAYTSTYVVVVTWGQRLKMTWGFWNKYVDESYTILTNDWVNSTGNLPNAKGFNWTQLQTDLGQIK